MEEKSETKFDEELIELLENEWFWLFNFNTDEKQNKEKMEHNEKQAQSLKEKLEQKYPNISLDINTIKRLGIQYSKWRAKENGKKSLENDWEKHKKEQKEYPDWISPGSVLDVEVTHRLLKREEQLRKNNIESPMPELKIIVASSKVNPNNLDMDILEYLRKRKVDREIY